MSQVSKRLLKGNIQKKIDDLFLEAISLLKSKEITYDFMNDLLTSTEKVMLSKRLAIAYLLFKGYSYRTINSILKVSNPTIRTVSLIMNFRGNGLKKILESISKKKDWQKLMNEIGEGITEIISKGKDGNWKQTESWKQQNKRERQSPL